MTTTEHFNDTSANASSSSSADRFNVTVEDYLLLMRGPKRMSEAVLLPITFVYCVIFVTGIVGNVSTVVVITRNQRMHSATNFYLVSLAISDLVTLILGLPNDLYVYWHQYPYIFGQVVCSVRALVSEMTSNASVLTITAFTVERYFAICHPFKTQAFSTLSRAVKVTAWIWALALVSSIPFAIISKVTYLQFPQNSGNILQESAFCLMSMENRTTTIPLLQFSSFVFFLLPMVLIMVLYIKISIALRQSPDVEGKYLQKSVGSRSSSESDSRVASLAARKSIINMLVAVVVVFFICFAPFHAQRLLAVYVNPAKWTMALRILNEYLFYIAGCLYFLSSTINPILYNVMSSKYREAFKATVCHYCYRQVPRSDSQLSAYYNSSLHTFRTKCLNENAQPTIYKQNSRDHVFDKLTSNDVVDDKTAYFANAENNSLLNKDGMLNGQSSV